MTHIGKVGRDHALKPAELQIFAADCPTHALSQKRVAVGPGHRLFIAVPKGEPPAGGWPVLYMLDGNAAFDFMTVDHLGLVPYLVLVGVGYDIDRQFARERRTLDFTAPDGPGDGIRPDPVHPGRMAGGAAQFLDLLTGPLRDQAEAGLPIDPRRRTIWGHSFGGLFVLYTLLTRPDTFAQFASISPSIWWDEPLIRRIAAAAPATSARVLMALGDREKRSGSDGPPPDGPAPATMAFAASLGVTPHILPGLQHIQTIAGSLPLALPFAASVEPR